MPIKKSAIKHLRQTKKKTARNVKVKSKLREFVKDVRRAIRENDKKRLEELSLNLQKVIDKAYHAKVIKKNTASRKKSRLMRQINTVLSESKKSHT